MSKRPLDIEQEFYDLLAKLTNKESRLTPRDADKYITRIVEIGAYIVTIKSPGGSILYRVIPESRLESTSQTCNNRSWMMTATKIKKTDPMTFASMLPTDKAAYCIDLESFDWEVSIHNRYGDVTVFSVSGRVSSSSIQESIDRAKAQVGVEKHSCAFQVNPFPRGAWSNRKTDCNGLFSKLARGLNKDGSTSFD